MKTFSLIRLLIIVTISVIFITISSQSHAQQQVSGGSSGHEGPITRPMVVEIAPGTYFINEYGMNSMYVLIGEERALVIDCGMGSFDFKGMIEKLLADPDNFEPQYYAIRHDVLMAKHIDTTLSGGLEGYEESLSTGPIIPYDVVITHGHVDHAGGMDQFDTVYIHPADTQRAFSIPYTQRVEDGGILPKLGVGYENVWGYSREDFRKWSRLPAIKAIYDGQVFDLGGGRKVTVYHSPGHSAGSCSFLDNYSRILFTGDAANFNVSTSIPVSTALRYLVRLQKLRPEYDQIYNGHTSYSNTIDVLSMKPGVLDDVIEAYRSILRGDAKLGKSTSHLRPGNIRTVAIYGRVQVGFDPGKLWEEGEEHIIP